MERSGRHRYYRLASGQVAAVLEALAGLAPMRPVRSLRDSIGAVQLRNARTCCDHLPGRLSVQITRALIDTGAITLTDGIAAPTVGRTTGSGASSRTPPTPSAPTARGFSAASASPLVGSPTTICAPAGRCGVSVGSGGSNIITSPAASAPIFSLRSSTPDG